MNGRMFYLPLGLPFLLLILLLIPLIFLFFMNVISSAFVRLGFNPVIAFAILFLSLVGSAVNIPLKTVYSEGETIRAETRRIYGFLYPTPHVEYGTRKTTIALNVGGALIPLMISLYLLATFPIHLEFLVSIAVVVGVCYRFARLVPRVGIAIPTFIPPATAAAVAVITTSLSPTPITYAPLVAYTSGVLGVLVGADLLHLKHIAGIGAPTASIGGAGTFDGIFITGILSVLLVSFIC